MAEYDVGVALERFDLLVKQVPPDRPAKRGQEKAGAARLVREVLFDRINACRAEGRTWGQIAKILNDAAVMLQEGEWTAVMVRKEMSREAQRRSHGHGGQASRAPAQQAPVVEALSSAPVVPPADPRGDVEAPVPPRRAPEPTEAPKQPRRLNFAPRNGGARSGLLTKE